MSQDVEKLIEAIVHRASLDREFRRKLLAFPEEAIQQAFGRSIPDGLRFKFVERDPEADFTFVLPDLRRDDEELSDEELEQAAGGADDWIGDP